MKVVTSQQMAQIESRAYHDGASETDFMEEAGSGVALVVHDLCEKFNLNKQVLLLCGKGNNAGDAYVTGIHLLHLEYSVTAIQIFPVDECSSLCRENYLRFLDEGGRVEEFTSIEEVTFPHFGVIVDGIFGTGFKGDVQEPISSIIRAANNSQLPIISVDIPSGLNGDTGEVQGEAIIATATAFLGLPKLGFFLREGWNYVGTLVYVDFGLPKEYVDASDALMIMLSSDMLRPLVPRMKRNRHKYQAGLVVGMAGSPMMPGAALLASLSSLRGGAGIVRLLHLDGMQSALASSPYELIKIPYKLNEVEGVLKWLNAASATFVGPGLGLDESMKNFLKEVIPRLQPPSVLDADALTIIAEGNISLPSHAILTPHLGEMKRLLHISSTILSLDFLQQCHSYASSKQLTLILKGGPSFIFHPGQPIMVNPRGDPGMATAGSGDVLTGLLAALLAQGLSTLHAAMLGVYLHARAGERSADELTSYAMIASDIISYFPDAFEFHNWMD